MQEITTTETTYGTLANIVRDCLLRHPKKLPSWLFYDETGDRIFQEITRMPGYYLTACEFEILTMNKEKLLGYFSSSRLPFQIIELGAGDGLKTEILLKSLFKSNIPFIYSPVDVSSHALDLLLTRLQSSLPTLTVNPINATYDEALKLLNDHGMRRVFMMMGANIGNYEVHAAAHLTCQLSLTMNSGDQLLVGFDLIKDPRLIQQAYDDKDGITSNFNINLLARLNRELGANFNLDQFRHYASYDPETGRATSYLVSLKDQDVRLTPQSEPVHFKRWEHIHTEVSQKYDLPMIEVLASHAGLRILEIFYDCKHYFCDVLFEKA